MRKAILMMLLAVVSGGATAAWAQEATMNADVVRKAILEVPLWHVDRSNGTSLWHFEMRGDKLWAKIVNIGGSACSGWRVQPVDATPSNLVTRLGGMPD